LTLVGHSLGATTSLLAASKNSSLFDNLILIGIDIDIERSNQYAFKFAQENAMKRQEKKILKLIDELKNQSIVTAKLFEKKAKIVSRYGGIDISKTYNQLLMDALKNLWQSKAYGIKDILKTLKGIEFCQNALLPKIEHLNLFKYEIDTSVPVHFIQGAKDAVTPAEVMQLYFESLDIPVKTLTIFHNSAHMPQFEEPEKFYQLLNTTIRQNEI
jgi:pimeloyl-ACP methyl ester carboxylesterase